MFTFANMMAFHRLGCARLCIIINYLFSFSRKRWHDFYGHEEYLLYWNKERNFEVGANRIPDLFNAPPHFYLTLIFLSLSNGLGLLT